MSEPHGCSVSGEEGASDASTSAFANFVRSVRNSKLTSERSRVGSTSSPNAMQCESMGADICKSSDKPPRIIGWETAAHASDERTRAAVPATLANSNSSTANSWKGASSFVVVDTGAWLKGFSPFDRRRMLIAQRTHGLHRSKEQVSTPNPHASASSRSQPLLDERGKVRLPPISPPLLREAPVTERSSQIQSDAPATTTAQYGRGLVAMRELSAIELLSYTKTTKGLRSANRFVDKMNSSAKGRRRDGITAAALFGAHQNDESSAFGNFASAVRLPMLSPAEMLGKMGYLEEEKPTTSTSPLFSMMRSRIRRLQQGITTQSANSSSSSENSSSSSTSIVTSSSDSDADSRSSNANDDDKQKKRRKGSDAFDDSFSSSSLASISLMGVAEMTADRNRDDGTKRARQRKKNVQTEEAKGRESKSIIIKTHNKKRHKRQKVTIKVTFDDTGGVEDLSAIHLGSSPSAEGKGSFGAEAPLAAPSTGMIEGLSMNGHEKSSPGSNGIFPLLTSIASGDGDRDGGGTGQLTSLGSVPSLTSLTPSGSASPQPDGASYLSSKESKLIAKRQQAAEMRRRRVAHGKFQYHCQGGSLGSVYRQEKIRQQEMELLLTAAGSVGGRGREETLPTGGARGDGDRVGDGRGFVWNKRGYRRRESRYAPNIILHPSDDEFEANDSQITAAVPLAVSLQYASGDEDGEEESAATKGMADELIADYVRRQQEAKKRAEDEAGKGGGVAGVGEEGRGSESSPSLSDQRALSIKMGPTPAELYMTGIAKCAMFHGLKHSHIRRRYYVRYLGVPSPLPFVVDEVDLTEVKTALVPVGPTVTTGAVNKSTRRQIVGTQRSLYGARLSRRDMCVSVIADDGGMRTTNGQAIVDVWIEPSSALSTAYPPVVTARNKKSVENLPLYYGTGYRPLLGEEREEERERSNREGSLTNSAAAPTPSTVGLMGQAEAQHISVENAKAEFAFPLREGFAVIDFNGGTASGEPRVLGVHSKGSEEDGIDWAQSFHAKILQSVLVPEARPVDLMSFEGTKISDILRSAPALCNSSTPHQQQQQQLLSPLSLGDMQADAQDHKTKRGIGSAGSAYSTTSISSRSSKNTTHTTPPAVTSNYANRGAIRDQKHLKDVVRRLSAKLAVCSGSGLAHSFPSPTHSSSQQQRRRSKSDDNSRGGGGVVSAFSNLEKILSRAVVKPAPLATIKRIATVTTMTISSHRGPLDQTTRDADVAEGTIEGHRREQHHRRADVGLGTRDIEQVDGEEGQVERQQQRKGEEEKEKNEHDDDDDFRPQPLGSASIGSPTHETLPAPEISSPPAPQTLPSRSPSAAKREKTLGDILAEMSGTSCCVSEEIPNKRLGSAAESAPLLKPPTKTSETASPVARRAESGMSVSGGLNNVRYRSPATVRLLVDEKSGMLLSDAANRHARTHTTSSVTLVPFMPPVLPTRTKPYDPSSSQLRGGGGGTDPLLTYMIVTGSAWTSAEALGLLGENQNENENNNYARRVVGPWHGARRGYNFPSKSSEAEGSASLSAVSAALFRTRCGERREDPSIRSSYSRDATPTRLHQQHAKETLKNDDTTPPYRRVPDAHQVFLTIGRDNENDDVVVNAGAGGEYRIPERRAHFSPSNSPPREPLSPATTAINHGNSSVLNTPHATPAKDPSSVLNGVGFPPSSQASQPWPSQRPFLIPLDAVCGVGGVTVFELTVTNADAMVGTHTLVRNPSSSPSISCSYSSTPFSSPSPLPLQSVAKETALDCMLESVLPQSTAMGRAHANSFILAGLREGGASGVGGEPFLLTCAFAMKHKGFFLYAATKALQMTGADAVVLEGGGGLAGLSGAADNTHRITAREWAARIQRILDSYALQGYQVGVGPSSQPSKGTSNVTSSSATTAVTTVQPIPALGTAPPKMVISGVAGFSAKGEADPSPPKCISLLPFSTPLLRMERGRYRMNAPLTWEISLEVDSHVFRSNPQALLRRIWARLKVMGCFRSFRSKRLVDIADHDAAAASNTVKRENDKTSSTRMDKGIGSKNKEGGSTQPQQQNALNNKGPRADDDGADGSDHDTHATSKFATQFSLWGAEPVGLLTCPYPLPTSILEKLAAHNGRSAPPPPLPSTDAHDAHTIHILHTSSMPAAVESCAADSLLGLSYRYAFPTSVVRHGVMPMYARLDNGGSKNNKRGTRGANNNSSTRASIAFAGGANNDVDGGSSSSSDGEGVSTAGFSGIGVVAAGEETSSTTASRTRQMIGIPAGFAAGIPRRRGKRIFVGFKEMPFVVPNDEANEAITAALAQQKSREAFVGMAEKEGGKANTSEGQRNTAGMARSSSHPHVRMPLSSATSESPIQKRLQLRTSSSPPPPGSSPPDAHNALKTHSTASTVANFETHYHDPVYAYPSPPSHRIREVIRVQMTGTQRHMVKFVKAFWGHGLAANAEGYCGAGAPPTQELKSEKYSAAAAGTSLVPLVGASSSQTSEDDHNPQLAIPCSPYYFGGAACGYAVLKEWAIATGDDGSAEYEATVKAAVIVQSCFRGWRCRRHHVRRIKYCVDALSRYHKALISYHEWFTKTLNSLARHMLDSKLQVIQIEARNRHKDIVSEEALEWAAHANRGVAAWQALEVRVRARLERDWLIDRHVSEVRFLAREQIWYPIRLDALWMFKRHQTETRELIDRNSITSDAALERKEIYGKLREAADACDPVLRAQRVLEERERQRLLRREERSKRKPMSLGKVLRL